jgi:hypothetical protein
MRHSLATARFVIVATLVAGAWSTVRAGSSFKAVTPPSDAPQAQQDSGSSIQNVPIPGGNVVAAPSGSSFKFITAPKILTARGDAQQAQAAPALPQSDESIAQANNVVQREQILLPSKTGRDISFNQPFTKILISNTDVIDAVPIDDLSVFLKAKDAGQSDIFFYNKGELIRVLSIVVDDSVVRKGAVADREARLLPPPAPWRVEIHNKALLTSATNFRCGADGCHYVDELTVTEPAPLPVGYSATTVAQPGTAPSPLPVTVPVAPKH